GVTGLGGHDTVTDYMVQQRPDWVLVLGTRLGEATSFWDNDLLPGRGFIQVDLDPEVFGTAYPNSNTIGIHAEIGHFLEALLPHFSEKKGTPTDAVGKRGPQGAATNVVQMPVRRWRDENDSKRKGPVSPRALMHAVQQHIVRGSDAVVMGECGNSFAWCNHYLRFSTPDRYRVSPRYGSMGHYAAGVVGAALARDGKAVAVLGDGSMLMNSEISTAVQYGAQAVWIILNNAGYGMCSDGHKALGLSVAETDIPEVDFVGLARAMGADGIHVESEDMLDGALGQALAADGPFVVDVRIDSEETSPLLKRFESLINQGSSRNIAGWEA
ncbi:MAG: thiamine pyrophosphate-binding protein, partial [bacterium]|nr:thiamine pyrophosphate-binding protein [bacterium]